MAELNNKPVENHGRFSNVCRLFFPPWLFLIALLAVHGVFLWSRFAPAIVTPDANGYWAQGSLLAKTGRTWFKPDADCQYIGMHWLVTPDEKYFSRYPPGLAVIVAAVYKYIGYKASVAVNPVMAVLTLAGLYILARRFVSGWWAIAGVAMLAVNPTFNQHAIACDSHMAATFFLTWGLYFLARWSQNGKIWEIFTAGLLLGVIPTIRYPEALFGVGIAVFLLWHWRRPHIPWHWLAAILGAAIPIVPLLIRNEAAFGSIWQTAYALTKEQSGFSWDYFKQHYVNYLRQVQGDGAGLTFALGLVGITWMCGVQRWRAAGVLLALLTVPITILYMAYYWAPQMGGSATMRFLLPTFICYVVAGIWLLAEALKQTSPAIRISVACVLVAVQSLWGVSTSWNNTERLHWQKDVLARLTDALEKHTQPGDVVMSRNQILQHLDFVRRWRLADQNLVWAPLVARFAPFLADGDAPSPMQREKMQRLGQKYAGKTPWERERLLVRDIRNWAGDHKVYFVGLESEIGRMRGWYFAPDTFKIVARVPIPEPPKEQRPEGLLGAGMRRGTTGTQLQPPQQPPGQPGMAPPPPGQEQPPPTWDRFAQRLRRDDQRPAAGGPQPPAPGGDLRVRRPGGMMGMEFLRGEKELVIAEWSLGGN